MRCIIVITILSTVIAEGSNRVKFVRDFLESSDFPLVLTSLICWDLEEKLALRRALPNTMMRTPSFDQIWHKNGDTNILRQHELFLLDTSCENTSDVLKTAEEHRLFASPYRWLLFNENSNYNVEENLQNFSLLSDSNMVIAEVVNPEIDLILYQVYKPSIEHALIKEHYGSWSPNNGFIDERKTRIISQRRRNLFGTTVRQSLVLTYNSTRNHLDDYENNNIDSVTRMCYRLTNDLLDAVNATKGYSYVPTWGYKDAKIEGGWSGMMGEIARGEAETGTSLFFTPDRLPVIDYITMMSSTQVRFVFRAPPLSYVSNLYLLPFGRGVWIACGILVAIMVLAMTIASLNESEEQSGLWSSLGDNLVVALSAICQQGYPTTPNNPPGRIAMLFLFIAFMFLYTSYTANIVSLLQSSTFSIRTLKDMLDSRLGFAAEDTVYNRHYFEHATEPVRRAIYDKKIAPKGKSPRFMNMSEGVRRLRQGFFAFHMERGPGYKMVQETFYEHEKCGLIEVDYLSFIDPWMPLRKGSPYKEIFKVNAFKLRESGLQSREQGRYYTKKPTCMTGGASFVSVGLSDSYFGVLILAVGFTIAISLLLVEILWRKMKILMDDRVGDGQDPGGILEYLN